MLVSDRPALVLAPMDGVTDAPMRALQGASGAFTYAVTEFVRVSVDAIQTKVFARDIPELACGGLTPTGMPVQVQILGGDPEKMARSALAACEAGAKGIDLNFGCPAPTVNRHDGGASLLRHPCRIRQIVAAVRAAVPQEIPVSAKLRLGWDSIDPVYENAAMAAEGGATWLTIHARTRVQGYLPPVYWPAIGRVRTSLGLPVIANGDIWTMDDFRRCQDETGCRHFMIGRSALASPGLPHQIARALGTATGEAETDWVRLMERLVSYSGNISDGRTLARMKQWLKLARLYGGFPHFDQLKTSSSVEELITILRRATGEPHNNALASKGTLR
jgi:tRNA-dihydrouridine synthase C